MMLSIFKSVEGDWSYVRVMSAYVILHTMWMWTYECIFIAQRKLTAEEIALIGVCLAIKTAQRFAEKKR